MAILVLTEVDNSPGYLASHDARWCQTLEVVYYQEMRYESRLPGRSR